jgi:hypothetical protein
MCLVPKRLLAEVPARCTGVMSVKEGSRCRGCHFVSSCLKYNASSKSLSPEDKDLLIKHFPVIEYQGRCCPN